MRKVIYRGIAGFVLAATLSLSGFAANEKSAGPGTLNYVEGQAAIGGETLDQKSVGAAGVQAGQVITTDQGRAEVLLIPGSFLRLDAHSAAKMLSAGLTNTEVEIQEGRATIEVTDIRKENNLRVLLNGAEVQIEKRGLYTFDAQHGTLRVFDGKAVVFDGNRPLEVKGGRMVALEGRGRLEAKKFDAKQFQDDFYEWSKLRSQYLAEANASAARLYVNGGRGYGYGYGPYGGGFYGNSWYGSGWYWNPWFGSYTFIPGAGAFYSPFGFGFYSPAYVYRAPVYYYRGGGFRNYAGRNPVLVLPQSGVPRASVPQSSSGNNGASVGAAPRLRTPGGNGGGTPGGVPRGGMGRFGGGGGHGRR
jgi:hypothetical protein